MRATILVLGLVAGSGVTPTLAQGALPNTGVGTSNAINQSFQQQNQIRGIQQQQRLNNNTNQLRDTTNQMNAAARYNASPKRVIRRPERER